MNWRRLRHPETPTLMYRSVVYDRQSRPIEYLTSVNHPQLVVFKTESSWEG